jgi:hypothetical protein
VYRLRLNSDEWAMRGMSGCIEEMNGQDDNIAAV